MQLWAGAGGKTRHESRESGQKGGGKKGVKPGREIYPLSSTSLRSPGSWIGREEGQILCQSQRKEARRSSKTSRSGSGPLLF